jgi:uncharacterized protein YeaO (DUF488 family)
LWLKDVAPSDALRRWFGHRAERWDTFRDRYLAELAANPQAFEPLLRLPIDKAITLLFAARDRDQNNAVVLAAHLVAQNSAS